MDDLKKIFNEVEFFEEGHIYKHKETGKELTSVSKLIHHYTPEFDPDGSILINCAAKKGVTPEELQKEWDKIRDDSCVRGSAFHNSAEHYLLTGEILKDEWEQQVKDVFSFETFDGIIYPEQMVYSLEHNVCGTSDIVNVKKNGKCLVRDYKTNKKLDKFSIFGNKFLPPISHLYDCNFTKYEIQLSTYAYFLELQGFWVDDLAIYHISHKGKVTFHKCQYRRNDVIRILDHFTGKQIKRRRFNPYQG